MAITKELAPHLTPALVNAILALTVANMTLAQLQAITDALSRTAGSQNNPNATIGGILSN